MNNSRITASAIVPAQPGSYLVQYHEGGDGRPDCVSYEPIIAWDIARYEGGYYLRRRGGTWSTHVVRPLTAYGDVEDDDKNFVAIQRPGGTYTMLWGGLGFDTEAKLIEEFRERRRRGRDRVEAAREAAARRAAMAVVTPVPDEDDRPF